MRPPTTTLTPTTDHIFRPPEFNLLRVYSGPIYYVLASLHLRRAIYRITSIFRGLKFSWLRSKPRNIYPRNSTIIYYNNRCNEPRSLVHAYTKPRIFFHEPAKFPYPRKFYPPKNTRYKVAIIIASCAMAIAITRASARN